MMRHFGVLIPSTNTTVEIEYNRLLPPTLQVHVGRLGKGVDTPFSPSRPEDISYQARMLGTAKVEVVCLAQTSASLFDDDYDATTTQQMTAGAGVPSLTSAQAIGQAVRALGARRMALVSPYSQEVIGRARWYFESRYLPIRPINFQLSVFQAARREQRLSLAIGGCRSVTLTRG